MKAIDMKYPITIGNTGYFDMNYDTFSSEKTKLINLMSTGEGERIMQPLFGLGMEKYIFEPITSELQQRIQSEITNKITFWLPNLNIDKINVDIVTDIDRNQIDITLQFSLIKNPTQFDTLTFRY